MYYSDVRSNVRQSAPLPVVLLTLFFALAVEFLPWPGWFLPYKPIFPVLMLVYWVVHQANYIGYAAACVIGIIIDLANQTPLGFNALSLLSVVMLVNVMRSRFILLTGFAQALHVFVVLAAGQYALYLLGFLEESVNQTTFRWSLFLPSVSSAVLWLFLPILVRSIRRAIAGRSRDD